MVMLEGLIVPRVNSRRISIQRHGPRRETCFLRDNRIVGIKAVTRFFKIKPGCSSRCREGLEVGVEDP